MGWGLRPLRSGQSEMLLQFSFSEPLMLSAVDGCRTTKDLLTPSDRNRRAARVYPHDDFQLAYYCRVVTRRAAVNGGSMFPMSLLTERTSRIADTHTLTIFYVTSGFGKAAACVALA
jgi:hypothetical protein